MSVDHHAYIGPYLRVVATVTKKTVDLCADHNFPKDASYCPQCGKSKAQQIYTYEDDGAPDDWEQDYQKKGEKKTSGGFWDYLSSTSIMSGPDIVEKNGKRTRTYLYTPNRAYGTLDLPEIEGGKYSEGDVPFDELDIKATTKEFTEAFKEEIDYLKQWFEVEIKFGYVSWCS